MTTHVPAPDAGATFRPIDVTGPFRATMTPTPTPPYGSERVQSKPVPSTGLSGVVWEVVIVGSRLVRDGAPAKPAPSPNGGEQCLQMREPCYRRR
jgi:hypothetical protein